MKTLYKQKSRCFSMLKGIMWEREFFYKTEVSDWKAFIIILISIKMLYMNLRLSPKFLHSPEDARIGPNPPLGAVKHSLKTHNILSSQTLNSNNRGMWITSLWIAVRIGKAGGWQSQNLGMSAVTNFSFNNSLDLYFPYYNFNDRSYILYTICVC